MKKEELLNLVEYELVSNLRSLKKADTWLTFFAILSLAFALMREITLVIISLVIVFFLIMKKHHESGEVRDYLRKKKGIPNKKKIKKIKSGGKNG
jgi:chromate transport protein ChrA